MHSYKTLENYIYILNIFTENFNLLLKNNSSEIFSALNCLTFDFIGTTVDESSDDLGTVQIPTAWRPVFLDFSTIKLFFDLYATLPSTLSPMVSILYFPPPR